MASRPLPPVVEVHGALRGQGAVAGEEHGDLLPLPYHGVDEDGAAGAGRDLQDLFLGAPVGEAVGDLGLGRLLRVGVEEAQPLLETLPSVALGEEEGGGRLGRRRGLPFLDLQEQGVLPYPEALQQEPPLSIPPGPGHRGPLPRQVVHPEGGQEGGVVHGYVHGVREIVRLPDPHGQAPVGAAEAVRLQAGGFPAGHGDGLRFLSRRRPEDLLEGAEVMEGGLGSEGVIQEAVTVPGIGEIVAQAVPEHAVHGGTRVVYYGAQEVGGLGGLVHPRGRIRTGGPAYLGYPYLQLPVGMLGYYPADEVHQRPAQPFLGTVEVLLRLPLHPDGLRVGVVGYRVHVVRGPLFQALVQVIVTQPGHPSHDYPGPRVHRPDLLGGGGQELQITVHVRRGHPELGDVLLVPYLPGGNQTPVAPAHRAHVVPPRLQVGRRVIPVIPTVGPGGRGAQYAQHLDAT